MISSHVTVMHITNDFMSLSFFVCSEIMTGICAAVTVQEDAVVENIIEPVQ